MECEQANPASIMDGVLMRVFAFFGDLIRDVMDDNDAVKNNQSDKDQQSKRKFLSKTMSI